MHLYRPELDNVFRKAELERWSQCPALCGSEARILREFLCRNLNSPNLCSLSDSTILVEINIKTFIAHESRVDDLWL
jgi:hypothetical protein